MVLTIPGGGFPRAVEGPVSQDWGRTKVVQTNFGYALLLGFRMSYGCTLRLCLGHIWRTLQRLAILAQATSCGAFATFDFSLRPTLKWALPPWGRVRIKRTVGNRGIVRSARDCQTYSRQTLPSPYLTHRRRKYSVRLPVS